MTDDHEHDERDVSSTLNVRSRRVTPEQLRTYEGYVSEIFTAFGLVPDTAETRETPRRFIRTLLDITDGYESLRTEFYVACGLHRFEPGSR